MKGVNEGGNEGGKLRIVNRRKEKITKNFEDNSN